MVQRGTSLRIWLVDRDSLLLEVSEAVGPVTLCSEVDTTHPISAFKRGVGPNLAQYFNQLVMPIIRRIVQGTAPLQGAVQHIYILK